MLLCDGVASSVRANDEQTRGFLSSSERIEEVDGRRIAPMQVLEDEDERELVADRLEGLEHLPEHPQGGGSDQAPLNRLELVVGKEPRHLCEPGRCLPGEQGDEMLTARLAGKSAKRLQHGQVRLSRATVLDALAVSDERLSRRAGSRRQVLDDGRLADPRFAGDEDKSSRAGLGFVVQPLEVGELALTTGNWLDELRENAGDGSVHGEADLLFGDVFERRVLVQHSPLEVPETRRGVDAKLIVEHAPERLEHVERLGVPSAPVQRQHELRAQTLAERMAAYERVELSDELEVATEGQLHLDALLQAVEVLLGKSGFLVPRERFLELRKGRPPPELERSAECRGSLAGSTPRERLAPACVELLEAAKVERLSGEFDELDATSPT